MSSSDATTIIVAGHLTVDPVDRDAYLRSCETAVRAARDADGCLDFVLGADLVDRTRISAYERWRDRPALETFRGQGPNDDQMSTHTDLDVGEYQVQQ